MIPRVAVTGLGVYSPIGRDVASFWDSLLNGRVGIGQLTRFPSGDIRSTMVAECPDPGGEAPNRVDRLALVAAREAMDQSGLEYLPEDAGIALGAGVGGLPESEAAYLEYLEDGRLGGKLRSFLGHLPATTADLLAKAFGSGGPRISVANACTSSTTALGQAALWIASGEMDCVLAGASDALALLTVGGFNSLRVVSLSPPRPFDAGRSGMVVGEGAAFLVLESESRARRRGIRTLAFLEGFGWSSDGYHNTAPEPEGAGAFGAMAMALRTAGASAEDVDHVNAHGTGTQANDRAEARALLRLLGPRASSVPVISIKGAVGHGLGVAGAMEAVASVLTLHHQVVPPSIGFSDPDPGAPLFIPVRPVEGQYRKVLSVNMAFGGNNAALLFGRAR